MEKQITSPAVKGVFISLILIVFGLVLYFTDLYTNQSLGFINYVILIGGVIWACISFAKQMDGNVTFGNVFAHGFKTSAAVAAITSVYTFIAMKFLFPDMVDKIIDMARQNMIDKGMDADQMNTALDMTRKYMMPFAIGGTLIMFAIVGAVASLIGAAVAKKKPQDPFGQPQM